MDNDGHVNMLSCQIDMRFVQQDTDNAVELLRSSVGCTEAKPECAGCLISRNAVDESQVRYQETWRSEAALQKHLRSKEFKRVLIAMDMCCEKPSVRIGNFTGQTGFALLQRLCSGQQTELVPNGTGSVEERMQ